MAQTAIWSLKRPINTTRHLHPHVARIRCSHESTFRGDGPLSAPREAPVAEEERLQRLFSLVHRSVNKDGTEAGLRTTHALLTQRGRVGNPVRVEFIRRSIERFLAAGDWDAAYSLYGRMRGEALPERAKVLKMLMESSIKLPATRPKVDQAFRDAINTLEKVGEPELQALLAHLIRGNADIFVIRGAMSKFQDKKVKDWKPAWKTYALLAQAEAKNGYDVAAEEYFKKGRQKIGFMRQKGQLNRKEHHDAKQELFTNLFMGYAAFRHDRPVLLNKLLLRMKHDHTTPSQRISNIIIALNAKKGRGQRAFGFYKSMRQSDPPVLPNSATFRHLFSLLLTPASSWWKVKYGGRQLFQHMFTQHAKNTNSRIAKSSNVLDTDVLNAALLLFMWRQDYAAATVTMKTFPACSISPNAGTQSSIITPLVTRIRKELLENSSRDVELWSDRMFGEMIRLWDGAWTRSDLSKMLFKAVRKFSSSVLDTGVDIGVLLAILRRAIISSANLWPGSDPVVEDQVVHNAVARAGAKMLPEDSYSNVLDMHF